eukprot:jgi/Tetstr1/421977/TSEL_001223.t1
MLLQRLSSSWGRFARGGAAAVCVATPTASTRAASSAATGADGGEGGGSAGSDVRISPEEVRAIAELACIDLDKAGGVERMAADMQAMLKFVSVMDGVSTEGVEPMWSPLEADFSCPLREDTAEKPAVSGPELLELAARSHAPYFTAPKDDIHQ